MDWFRMYGEFATDPKVQSMSEAMQRRLTMLLCLRCSNTLETLLDDEVAFALRIDTEQLAETRVLFQKKGFLGEGWQLANWEKRQKPSDSSADRVAKHRAKVKEQAAALEKRIRNVTESAQIREEENRTEDKTLGAAAPGELPGIAPPPTPAKPAPKAANPAGGDADFEKAWAMYPARDGGNSRKEALGKWNARISEGVKPEVMLAGLERYKAHMTAKGEIGSRFVMQGATFFGPGERYLEAWPVKRGGAAQTNGLMLVAGQDHSSTKAAMEASIAARGAQLADDDMKFN